MLIKTQILNLVKIFHEYVNQSTTKNVKDDLQKLDDKINMFAGQKGVLIHDIKYERSNATNDYRICSPHGCK
jgi:phosphoribosylaminoimidazole-succinocarboxamide synthase